MSKNITSYFKPISKSKEKAPPKIDLSDDDVIPESPDVQIKSKKKESKKKRSRIIDDSSDEEIFSKKKKPTVEVEKKSSKSSKDQKPEKKLQEVKTTDLFGTGPIKRTEPLVKKAKKDTVTEIGIHDDEDFEKSLLEIDNIDELVHGEKTKLNKEQTSTEKVESITEDVKKSPKKSNAIQICLKVNGVSHKKDKSPRKDEATVSNKKDKSPKKSETITSLKKETKDHEPKQSVKLDNYKIPKTTSAENKHGQSKKETDSKKNEGSKSKNEDHGGSKSFDEKDRASSSKNKKREDYVSSKMDKNKRDFSEFIGDNEANHEDDEHESTNKNKKKKLDTSLNSSVLSDEERHERKRHSAILYQSYLNRSGPKNLGTKEIPEGAPNCLKGCAFLLTGVLDSFEREEISEAVTKYGGCLKSGVTKKVTHVLAGNDAGPAKLAKAEDLGIKIISEDEFLQMIRDSTKTSKDVPKNKHATIGSKERKSDKDDKSDKKPKTDDSSESKSAPKLSDKPKKVSEDKIKSFEDKIKKNFYSKTKDAPISIDSSTEKDPKPSTSVLKTEVKSEKCEETAEASCSKPGEMKKEPSVSQSAPNSLMWVDKYKPQSVKQIIGQHGDASNAKKLINWLTKWYVNRREKIPKPSPWAKNDAGAYYKAVLLSGPPGVGKTTTVTLVCKELGFDAVEFNASDTRSKTLIKQQIGELLTTTSLSGYAKGDTGKQAVTKKHVLVMDEVDGMAGNEDRGGLQELISLIKTTSVPVICMCNDRNSEKMRTLVNYCYDLKFSKPRVDQIKSAMLSVCCKERIKISPDTLARLITSCNQDVRQTLNALSMWAVDPDSQKLSDDADSTRKDLKLGPWEAVRKVFSAEDHKRMSINDKSDLFFYDYSLAPLFVHENYLSVAPHCDKKQVLSRIAEAADSLSLGDTVERRIRSSQAWGLLPLQAMYSSVIPGSALSGHVAGQIQFPGWLGKNSRANKMNRLAQEIHAHTRLSTTGSKSSIYLDYSKHLRDAIVTPLIKDKADGIPTSIQVLSDYHLLREDLDSLTELASWPGQRDPMLLVDSKIKAAMTRAYNKHAPALPHAAASFTRGKRREREDAGDEGESESLSLSPSDSEPESDGLIKVKKTTSNASKGKDDKPGTSKGKKVKAKK